MRQYLKISGAALALLGLVACGDTAGEQAIIGGAAGAGTAAVLNTNILTGAAVGAAGNTIFCQTNPGKCS
ncbi:hypothetical protein G5B38_18500 [Pseudohalocynthiibacter aestuariivivens]|uniref:Lipoprotein n=1 Tax=Roseovarius pelagicus TaxID=2980108 RepID=A0ABY6DDE0_9RHOB|nr:MULTISPECIES: hypothetical protein [Rhodobacterales]QIE47353.1 hypothetical protein G5B38_18500 [Pseudohalocynthiibacter aestuariivivens]UXX84085.1 hypothetical protein N7U68_05375 [Roseovarius pelagicus]